MSLVEEHIVYDGASLLLRWHPASVDLPAAFRQVRAYIFNRSGEVLLVQASDKSWGTVGGTREGEETPSETLVREVLEEASVEIENAQYLGAIEVVPQKGPQYLQLRYVASLQRELPFTPNPSDTINRQWVAPSAIGDYIPWTKKSPIFSEEIGAALSYFQKLKSL